SCCLPPPAIISSRSQRCVLSFGNVAFMAVGADVSALLTMKAGPSRLQPPLDSPLRRGGGGRALGGGADRRIALAFCPTRHPGGRGLRPHCRTDRRGAAAHGLAACGDLSGAAASSPYGRTSTIDHREGLWDCGARSRSAHLRIFPKEPKPSATGAFPRLPTP